MKIVRYGVIGIKGIGKWHAHLAKNNKRAELTAIVDVDKDLVNVKSKELGVRGFTNYLDLLESGIVDAVSICTPHCLHGKMSLDSLNAGLHIFIEKPIANRVSEADAIIALAKDKNLKVCVGHQYRTYKSSQIMKNLVDTGEVGNIMRVLWSWVDFRPESYYSRKIWHASWQHSGGGVLMNQVSHQLDLICWIVGKPSQVSAQIGNQLHRAEIEDVVCANILFSNGAFGSFQATLNQPKGYSIRQIAGDQGTIAIQDVKSMINDQDDQILLGKFEDSLRNMVIYLEGDHDQPGVSWQLGKLPSNKDRTIFRRLARKFNRVVLKNFSNFEYEFKRPDWLKWSNPIGHRALMNSFIDSIIEGGEPLVSGESTLTTVELINAIVLSSMRKKTVELPIDRDEYDQLFEDLVRGKTGVPRFR